MNYLSALSYVLLWILAGMLTGLCMYLFFNYSLKRKKRIDQLQNRIKDREENNDLYEYLDKNL